jgi:predicted Zn finger-like uncharacterized protein
VYTQCPDCATVFRVTAEALKIAQGDVRCGVCSTTFNALENLSEKAFKPGPEAEASSPDDSMTVEELPGGENIELSAPVELAIVPEAQPAEASPPEPGPTVAAPADTAAEAEPESEAGVVVDDEQRAMEFHGDAADLDRLFVVENPAVARFDPGEAASTGGESAPVVDLDSTDEHPILVLDERDEPPGDVVVESIVLETLEPVAAPVPPPAVASSPISTPPPPPEPPPPVSSPPPAPAAQPAPKPAPVPEPKAAPKPAARQQTARRIVIPDEMRKHLVEEAEARAAADAFLEPGEGGSAPLLAKRWPWIAGVAFLALLLLLQVLHTQRNELVRSPTVGPVVAGAYAFFGLSVLAPTDLAAYELRQWGAASDPNEANRLMLRASIVNRAAFAQPFPLLRLSLQDRFGGTLHLRDISPSDYLPGAGGEGLLGPGERADALIRIVDPGPEVVGFELDICLPAPGGVRCANPIKTASS